MSRYMRRSMLVSLSDEESNGGDRCVGRRGLRVVSLFLIGPGGVSNIRVLYEVSGLFGGVEITTCCAGLSC